MKKLLLLLGLLWASPTLAQIPCIGVGGVNTVPQPGTACVQEPAVGTYAATSVGLVAAATPTDIACITGAANRVIRVQRVAISGTISTQLVVPVFLTKHASANTGGTPATGTALPVPYRLDSTNGAPLAATTAYTANPTIADAAPGIINSGNLILSKADNTNGSGNAGVLWDYMLHQYMEAPILRGVAQQLCVNLNANAGTMTGNSISITFMWTESAQ